MKVFCNVSIETKALQKTYRESFYTLPIYGLINNRGNIAHNDMDH